MKDDEVWVKHSKHGDVKFTHLTIRQKDVLEHYTKLKSSIEELKELTKEYPNNFEFGSSVREILRKVKYGIKRISNNNK